MARVRILREAAEEVAAAAAILERERPGYGQVFLDEYEERLDQVTRFPKSGPRVKTAPAGYELRAFLTHKFGYSVIVGLIDGILTIVAVAHQQRRPGYWTDRVE